MTNNGDVDNRAIVFNTKPYYQDDKITLYHGDCRKVLPFLRNHDLLLTDPPYGLGQTKATFDARGEKPGPNGQKVSLKQHFRFKWDMQKAPQWLIEEAIAKCCRSIIWGGNFYDLPASKCWLVWDKEKGNSWGADCELAWTNLDISIQRVKHLWNGMMRKGAEHRYHPTQKPLDVISWAIECAKDVASILDPFAGSGTTLVAAKLKEIKATGIERSEKYCDVAAHRLQVAERKLKPRFRSRTNAHQKLH